MALESPHVELSRQRCDSCVDYWWKDLNVDPVWGAAGIFRGCGEALGMSGSRQVHGQMGGHHSVPGTCLCPAPKLLETPGPLQRTGLVLA